MLSTVVMQDRVAAPSTCMVQAPHSAWPQPNLVPVTPQHPQQRGVAVDIDLVGCAVDPQRESHGCLSVAGADRTQQWARVAHGRTRMIVFPLRRSVGFKAATASSRVE